MAYLRAYLQVEQLPITPIQVLLSHVSDHVTLDVVHPTVAPEWVRLKKALAGGMISGQPHTEKKIATLFNLQEIDGIQILHVKCSIQKA